MPPEGWDGVHRILVVRLDNIGDVVMTGPALRALRRAMPEASITLMASPAGGRVAPLLPWLDGVLVHRALWQDASGTTPLDPDREAALVRAIRARRFDAAVILTSFSQSPYPPAYACYLAGVPVRLGQSREFGGGVLSRWVKPPPDATHQVDRNLHLLEAAGISPAGRELELSLPRAARMGADALLRAHGIDPAAPFIVLAPGASCQARRYDPERLGPAARILAAETRLPIVVVGTEREGPLARPVLAALQGYRAASLAGRTSVPQLAAVVRHAALVVANNSGVMHLADAFRRPVLVLFSGTDLESQWRPRGAPAVLLRRPTDCSPCYAFRCPYGMECLDIPPDAVAKAALRLLGQTAGAARELAHPDTKGGR